MRGVFDIVGPIMIGPSSSHTAGAARLGLMAGKILGEPVAKAEILLHGSFARTYRGHGTDKALIGGLLFFSPEDERIRDALDIAKERGLDYSFAPVDLGDAHPNTAVFVLTGINGRKITVGGASVGGGNIEVRNIDSFQIALTGQYPSLIIVHTDKPGVIRDISDVLAKHRVNIAFMRVFRRNRGQQAMMIIETDEELTEDIIQDCRSTGDIENTFAVPAI